MGNVGKCWSRVFIFCSSFRGDLIDRCCRACTCFRQRAIRMRNGVRWTSEIRAFWSDIISNYS